MNLDDCHIIEFRTEENKYGVKILHMPTGVSIEGNCGWVDKIDEVKQILLARLEESIKDAPPLPRPKPIESREQIVEQCAKAIERYATKNADETSLARALAKAVRAIK